MAPAGLSEGGPPRPEVVLPVFEGPLDLLLHLVRENRVSIWDIPIARICDQYHESLRRMEELDFEVAGEYLVYAAWLLVIKSRMLLPRPADGAAEDPRRDLVERLLEYEKVKSSAGELAVIAEIRRGVLPVGLPSPDLSSEQGVELEEVDVLMLAEALREVVERHRREHPPGIEVTPIRYSVRDKIIELFDLVQHQPSFPLLSHFLTRPDRLEGVTLLLAALELVRLRTVRLHQRRPFAEIYLTATGEALRVEGLSDG